MGWGSVPVLTAVSDGDIQSFAQSSLAHTKTITEQISV
jgi:hypothetical protein